VSTNATTLDPRYQPDTYLALGRHLYEVIGWENTGPSSGMLRVRNCRTLHEVSLGVDEVARAEVITPALDEVTTNLEAVLEVGKTMFGGRPFTREQARDWLIGPDYD
jgi:hypothetical protein